jgi:hypothetical protein
MDYDDVMLTLSGLWWTAYLSVWTGRRRAGCLVVAWWCRGVEFLFFMQVSRLGLWSRIVLACWFLFELCILEMRCYLLFEYWRIYLYLVWRSRDVYEWYVVPLLCCVTWSLCMYFCGLFGDVASISRIFLMYSRVLPLNRNRMLHVPLHMLYLGSMFRNNIKGAPFFTFKICGGIQFLEKLSLGVPVDMVVLPFVSFYHIYLSLIHRFYFHFYLIFFLLYCDYELWYYSSSMNHTYFSY